MPRSRKTADLSSSPDPLELLPPPRFSPFRRNPNSPHKQLQLRLLELNADITNDRVASPSITAVDIDNRECASRIDSREGKEFLLVCGWKREWKGIIRYDEETGCETGTTEEEEG